MKKITLISILLGICYFSQAQLYNQKELDSLMKRLSSYQKEDSIKVDLMNDIIFEYASSNPQKGIELAGKAFKLAAKLKLHKKISTVYNYKALCYASAGSDSLAIVNYNISLQNSKKHKLRESYASTLNNLAILYTNQGKYKDGLKLREQALTIFKQLGNERKAMLMLQNIGVSYFYLGNYAEAIKNYNHARIYSLKINDIGTQANCMANIALCYSKLGQNKIALNYYQQALSIANQKDLFDLQVNTLTNLGNLYSDMVMADKAIQSYEKAIGISKKTGNTRGLLNAYANLGDLYLKSQNNYEKAYEYLSNAEGLSKRTQNNQTISLINGGLATVLLNATNEQLLSFGFNLKQRLSIAEDYAMKGLQSATETESPVNLMHANKTLSDVHQKLGKYELALVEFKKYTHLKDSLLSDEKKIEFVKQEMSFETEKQKLIAKEELEKEKIIRQQITLIGVITIVFLIIGFVVYKYLRDNRQLKRELLHKTQTAENEIQILRLQMNPHFIFNSLNSISYYMHKNDMEKADYYLTNFAKLMRGILENAEEKEITLAEEINMMEAYMQLEASRLDHKFTYEINVAEEIDKDNTYVPCLIMQPFIENSIWHGFANEDLKGKISIDIFKDQSSLKCIIDDNGVGIKDIASSKKSYGIKITKERLALLKGANAHIKVSELAQGTRVEITLPFETEI